MENILGAIYGTYLLMHASQAYKNETEKELGKAMEQQKETEKILKELEELGLN